MKKIVLVDASPRKNGNSEIVVDTLAAALPGAAVTVVKLREKKANPCMACGACQGKETPHCVQKDDIAALTDTLENCDAIVLASPIYFQQVSAQAKAFIDRLYCFFNAAKPGMSNSGKRGKKAALVCSFWGGPQDVYAAYAAETVKSFSVMGADSLRTCVFGGIPNRGDIKAHADYLTELQKLAKWLAE